MRQIIAGVGFVLMIALGLYYIHLDNFRKSTDPLSILMSKKDKETVCMYGDIDTKILHRFVKWLPSAMYYVIDGKKKVQNLMGQLSKVSLGQFGENCDIIYINGQAATKNKLMELRLFANPDNLIVVENCQKLPSYISELTGDGPLNPLETMGTNLCFGSFTEPQRTLDEIRRVSSRKTMVHDKNADLYKRIKEMDAMGMEGDFVECGVWRGGTSLLMALATNKDRTIWMYDTYEGHTGEYDANKDDKVLQNKWKNLQNLAASKQYDRTTFTDKNGKIHWTEAGVELVRHNMKLTSKTHHLIKGKVEDTLKERIPEKIAILRLDTDFYSSTKAELDILFPLVVPGGLIVIDDYCKWKGSRVATDEFLAESPNAMCNIIKTGTLCFQATKCV